MFEKFENFQRMPIFFSPLWSMWNAQLKLVESDPTRILISEKQNTMDQDGRKLWGNILKDRNNNLSGQQGVVIRERSWLGWVFQLIPHGRDPYEGGCQRKRFGMEI